MKNSGSSSKGPTSSSKGCGPSSKGSGSSSRPSKSSGPPPKATTGRSGGGQGKPTISAPAKMQPTTTTKSKAVEFSGHAKRQLGNLGLNKTQRNEVEHWHTRITRREMTHLGADQAKIRYLGHSETSQDNKAHITASLKSKDGKTIKNEHGNLSHLYYDANRMPPAFATAIRKGE